MGGEVAGWVVEGGGGVVGGGGGGLGDRKGCELGVREMGGGCGWVEGLSELYLIEGWVRGEGKKAGRNKRGRGVFI